MNKGCAGKELQDQVKVENEVRVFKHSSLIGELVAPPHKKVTSHELL
jgi:hypothetical protein